MPKKTYSTYESQSFAGKVVTTPDPHARRIELNAPAYFQHFLKNTCQIGDMVTMYITNKKPKRTEAQNRYLHLYLGLIALSCGHTVEELKVWIKGKFLSKGITEVYGDKIRVVRGTHELTKLEFIELLAQIEETTEIPLPVTDPFLDPMTQEEWDALKADQKKVYSKLVAKIK